MKIIQILFLLILIFPLGSSIIISEVEMNGPDGEEWIELYNEDSFEINLSNWELWDFLTSSRNIYTIPENTSLGPGEFYIAELSSSKLNNGGDKVILYDFNLTEVDSTLEIEDNNKDMQTWSFCNNKWIFGNSSKNQENNCVSETPIEDPEPEENSSSQENSEDNLEDSQENSETFEETPEDFSQKTFETKKTKNSSNDSSEKIILTSNTVDSNSKPLKKKINSVYYIVTFCLLLGLLMALKFLKPKPKNEFRENNEL